MERQPGRASSPLVSTLLDDHATIRSLLAALDAAAEPERETALRKLVAELASHESAEEAVVYPALRQAAAGGRAIADDRLAEELAAEHHLHDLEAAGPHDRWFGGAVARLRREVEEHATAEERTVFPVLESTLDADRLATLHDEYTRARRRGPTHPHPLSPHKSRATAVAAPLAGMVDRVGDTLTGRRRGQRPGEA